MWCIVTLRASPTVLHLKLSFLFFWQKQKKPSPTVPHPSTLLVWIISHHHPAILFSQNKSAPVTSQHVAEMEIAGCH
jgi:hypothetical protein